jgi:putative redox protein
LKNIFILNYSSFNNTKLIDLKTTLRYTADNEFEAENLSGNILKMDMHPREKKQHQSPMEMLLSAVAGCSAVDVVEILKKKRKSIKAFSVETEGIRRDEIPRKFTHITMTFILDSPDTNVEELDKVVKLSVEKYCSVASSLSSEIKLIYQSKVLSTV